MNWETLDVRARVDGGCYYITFARDPAGAAYIARFCADPRPEQVNTYTPGNADWSYNRFRGIGHSESLERVKEMCENDNRYGRTIGQ